MDIESHQLWFRLLCSPIEEYNAHEAIQLAKFVMDPNCEHHHEAEVKVQISHIISHHNGKCKNVHHLYGNDNERSGMQIWDVVEDEDPNE